MVGKVGESDDRLTQKEIEKMSCMGELQTSGSATVIHDGDD